MSIHDHVDWENLNVPKFLTLESLFFIGECLFVHPLDVIRCKLQVSKEELSWRGIKDVVHRSGLRGLYTALSMDFLYIPGNVIYFITYFYAKEALQKRHDAMFEKKKKSSDQTYRQALWVTCLAAMVADLASISLFCPIEVVQQRMYLQADAPVRKYNSNRHAFRTILQEEGLSAFFKGIHPLAINTVPASATWWCVYETTKRKMTKYFHKKDQQGNFTPTESELLTRNSIVQAGSGAAAGFVSTLLTNPLEIVRTRLQTDTNKTAGGIRLTGEFLKNIYQKEGMRALFRGVTPRLIQWSSLSAVNAFFYETAVRLSRIDKS